MTSLRILGVMVNDKLTAADHVTMLLSSCSRMLYAMSVLRARGTPTTSLHDIFHATAVSRIEYAAPAWSGLCSAAHFYFCILISILILSQFLLEFCLLSLSRSNCVYCSFYHCIESIYLAVKLLVCFNKLTVYCLLLTEI